MYKPNVMLQSIFKSIYVDSQSMCTNGCLLFLKSESNSSEVYSKKQFCAAVRDAHIALSDQRCRNAEQSFSEALRILGSIGNKVSCDPPTLCIKERGILRVFCKFR